MSQLLPCPFCLGDQVKLFPPTCKETDKYNPLDRVFPRVRCRCGASVDGKNWDYGGTTAVRAWNGRPALPLEARGCPTPGACSCPTVPIVPPELIRALQVAAAALECAGASQELPRIRHALQTWATPPADANRVIYGETPEQRRRRAAGEAGKAAADAAIDDVVGHRRDVLVPATREAGLLPRAGAEISDEELEAIAKKAEVINMKSQCGLTASSIPGIYNQLHGQRIAGLRAVWDRAVLARWGGAAREVPVAPAGFFPVEYADADGIRIVMEPSEETGRACWVVRNSRHVNPFHEFPAPEVAYAAHRSAAAGEEQ